MEKNIISKVWQNIHISDILIHISDINYEIADSTVSCFIIIIIIIIILLKQDYKVQLANNKIQMAWLTCWLVVG